MIRYQFLVLSFAVATSIFACTVGGGDDPTAPPPSYRVMDLLERPFIRSELDLIDTQLAALATLDARRDELEGGPLNLGLQETREERVAAYREFRRQRLELENEALAILLPHQQRRLQQILLQEFIVTQHAHGGITHPQMTKRLGLVEPQLEEVRQVAIAAEKEFKEREAKLLLEIAKAKEEARKKVRDALTPEQRKKYEELVGKHIDLTKLD